MAQHIASGRYSTSRNPSGVKLLHKYSDVVGPTQEMHIHGPYVGQWDCQNQKASSGCLLQDSSGLCLQVHVRSVSIAFSFKKR